jgi:hypothetical protein
MNGTLQLEEGPNAEEGAMNIKIPQYASQSKTCASPETALEEIKLQTIFDEKSTSVLILKGKDDNNLKEALHEVMAPGQCSKLFPYIN